jgi:hypothetical protein
MINGQMLRQISIDDALSRGVNESAIAVAHP